MSPGPAVSVILPTHNRRATLEKAVGSVLSQTFDDFELIIVDDASSDGTSQYVAGLDDRRVRCLRLERRSGPARARNAGIRAASAPLLAFQDSDDRWLPGKLARQVAMMRAGPPELGLVVGAYTLVEDGRRRTVRSDALERGEGYGEDIVRGVPLVTPLWLARRTALDAAGLFDETLQSSEDYELAFRLSRVCRFRAVPELVLEKQGHLGSLSANEPLLLRGLQIVLGRYPEFLEPYPAAEADLLCTVAALQRRAGARAAAARTLMRAWSRQPLRLSIARRLVTLYAGRRALRASLWRLLRKGPRAMRAFARLYPEARFVQIGSNDGDKHDPLRRALLRSRWRGVMVEPVPYVFERLKGNYGDMPGIALENAAVTATNSAASLPFHYVAQAAPGEALPDWYDEIGSFRKDVLLSHADRIAQLQERLVTAHVPCLTLEALCAKHKLDAVDLIHMDTEGYDAELVGALDLERRRPLLLIYENKHLDTSTRAACRARLEAAGYECFDEAADTWCLDTRVRDGRHRDLLRAWRFIARWTIAP